MSRAEQISATLFYQVAGIAWNHLSAETEQAIRQTSSTGRTLHDSRITDLVVRLGHGKPDMRGLSRNMHLDDDVGPGRGEDAPACRAPTPDELRASLAAARRRGARVQCLRLRFWRAGGALPPAKEREEQLLAVMEALSGCPATTLLLIGGVPMSADIASAVARSLPCLTSLTLDFGWAANDLPQADNDTGAASQYYYGAMQLLTLCGPRLTELELCGGVHHWPSVAFQALRHCTALTSLRVEAGRKAEGDDPNDGYYLGSPAQEDGIVSPIAQLTSLRSLHLGACVDPVDLSPEALAPYVTILARLSALTALTKLRLHLSPCYEDHGDAWSRQEEDGEQHAAWVEVREVHRASLLSALCCMPQLQDLDCPTLWLHPTEAASLTALTSLALGGLHPPPHPQDGARKVSHLPPQLEELTVDTALSPRLLASLQVPSTLTALHLYRLRFGMSDVTPDNQLLPETVEAVGPAMSLFASMLTDDCPWANFIMVADGGPELLLPRAGVPDGHVEWLRHLTGLDGVEMVELHCVALQFEDVCCLAHTLGGVRVLTLEDTCLPVTALPALLGLTALEELRIDLSRVAGLTHTSLEAALLLLGSQSPKLRRLTCTHCPLPGPHELEVSVQEKLRGKGRSGIEMTIVD